MLEILLTALFGVGYAAIALEHNIKVNKSATALLTAVSLWVVYVIMEVDEGEVLGNLTESLGDASSVLFFVLAAMTIVELIDAHDGFQIITSRITLRDKVALLWTLGGLTFFLSAILDNLTTTIVMITLLRKLMRNREERYMFVGAIVIAANAGGAWSPIGDVSTTMLWIGNRISALNTVREVFLPSVACLVVPLTAMSFQLRGTIEAHPALGEERSVSIHRSHQLIVFLAGLSVFVLIPIFKTVTGLPPVMGAVAGLGLLWILIEIIHIHKDEEEKHVFSVVQALRKIDTASILFFLGILLAVDVLESTGILAYLEVWLDSTIGNQSVIVTVLGAVSAVLDNVPLVAATMGMYPVSQFPIDHQVWQLIAYACGTGGSMLIIGSAAGIAAMGLEKISFGWYLKRITPAATAGYAAGIGVFLAMG